MNTPHETLETRSARMLHFAGRWAAQAIEEHGPHSDIGCAARTVAHLAAAPRLGPLPDALTDLLTAARESDDNLLEMRATALRADAVGILDDSLTALS